MVSVANRFNYIAGSLRHAFGKHLIKELVSCVPNFDRQSVSALFWQVAHQGKAALNILVHSGTLTNDLTALRHRKEKNDTLQLLKGLHKGGSRKRMVERQQPLEMHSELTRIWSVARH